MTVYQQLRWKRVIFVFKPKHWLLLLTGGKVSRKACSKKPWYSKEPGMFCFRALALHSVACIAFEFTANSTSSQKIICCCCRCAKIKQNTALIDDIFFKIRQQLLPLKPDKYCTCSVGSTSTTPQEPGSSRRQVGSIYSLAKRGLPSRVWNRIQRHFRAEFAKLESDASDRVQSERPEDIPGSISNITAF